jgi:hypothetical protein
MTAKTIDLVIARYNENLDWLKDYSTYQFNRVFIYNKGKSDVELPESFKSIKPPIYEKLPNVGRCDHSYIYHIIKYYDDLGDVTIFIKGSTICPDRGPQREPAKLKKVLEKVFETKNSYFIGWKYQPNLKNSIGNFTLSHYMGACKQNINSTTSIPLHPANPRPFKAWYELRYPNIVEDRAAFAATFAVSKTHIHQREKEDYEPFLQELAVHSNPEAGHFIERSWLALFYPIPDKCFEENQALQGGGKTYRKRRRFNKRKRTRSGCAK